jgi:hypothetical protein
MSAGRSVSLAKHANMLWSWAAAGAFASTRIVTRPWMSKCSALLCKVRMIVPCLGGVGRVVSGGGVTGVDGAGRAGTVHLLPQGEHQLGCESAAGLPGVDDQAVAAAGVQAKRERLAELTGEGAVTVSGTL